jgi:poly-gamma-glutamate capsule biosynthesis protein CapA/YwtB (metallophosphatase superfamily)
MHSRAGNYRSKRKKGRVRLILFSLGVSFFLSLLVLTFLFIWQKDYRVEQQPALEQPSKEAENREKLSPDTHEVRLAFVGDILLGGKVSNLLTQHGYDYPYSYVEKWLKEADMAVGNLESPVTERGLPQEKEYVFRTSPAALPALSESGVDIVNLANNHVLDYGKEGLIDTLEHLRGSGIQYVGAGRDQAEAYQPVYVEKNNVRIAFVGFSRVIPDPSWGAADKQPGVAVTYDPKFALESIKEARGEADIVVVLVHWGVELQETPEPYQVDLAHQYIDAGADLVIGSHPHVLQGLEIYKGKGIAYSLGNFIFTTSHHPPTWETAILETTCSPAKGCQLQLIPIFTKWGKPQPMDQENGSQLLERLNRLSIHAKVQIDGKVIHKP